MALCGADPALLIGYTPRQNYKRAPSIFSPPIVPFDLSVMLLFTTNRMADATNRCKSRWPIPSKNAAALQNNDDTYVVVHPAAKLINDIRSPFYLTPPKWPIPFKILQQETRTNVV